LHSLTTEPRLLLAYALILLIGAGLVLVWRRVTRESRGDRRAYQKSERSRRKRRDARVREERGA
jgi:ABC-type nickel/cobalt efflux system permease component RcnA